MWDSGRPRERRLCRGGVATPLGNLRLRRAGLPREAGKGSEKLGNLRDALGGTERKGSASFRAVAGGRSLKGQSTGVSRSGECQVVTSCLPSSCLGFGGAKGHSARRGSLCLLPLPPKNWEV